MGEIETRKDRDGVEITGYRARYTGPDLQRHSRVFADKMAAETWLNDERILIDRDEWIAPRERDRKARIAKQRTITFGEWARRSIAGKRLRPSTVYRYERALELRVLPVLGDVPLSDLTRLDITDRYTGLVTDLAAEAKKAGRKGDGRGAAFSAYQVVSSILNDAVDHELIEVSPAKVRRALQYDAMHEPVVLTAGQMWQLHELMPDYLAAMVPLAATTGLRNGELRALQRRHLDLRDPLRAWSWCVARPRSGRSPAATTPSARRRPRHRCATFAIPSCVVPILEEHLREHVQRGPDALVFAARRGGIMHASVLERNWAVARAKVGLDDMHIHDLRRTALTWAARSGATLAELMAIADHKNPTIALRYQHIGGAERRHAIAERIGAMATDQLAARRARKAKEQDAASGD